MVRREYACLHGDLAHVIRAHQIQPGKKSNRNGIHSLDQFMPRNGKIVGCLKQEMLGEVLYMHLDIKATITLILRHGENDILLELF